VQTLAPAPPPTEESAGSPPRSETAPQSPAAAPGHRPKLLFLVTEDWSFVSHRLQLAQAALEAGYEVHVATRVDREADRIREAGLILHPLALQRSVFSPRGHLRAVREVTRIYREVRPDIVHHVALRPVVYGGIAARRADVARGINAIAGLGFVFTERSWKAALIRPLVLAVLRRILRPSGWITLFQNPDDQNFLTGACGLDSARVSLIRGAGVDTETFVPLPEPAEGPVTIAVASRMVRFKGIADLVAASEQLQSRGVAHRLLLAGTPDTTNPAVISEAELAEWDRQPQIEWRGHVADVRSLWAEAHVAALASHGGEGLPKTLLEAAACGRPVVATDVPGTREVVQHDRTGLLVPPRRPDLLAAALERLVLDAEERRRFGAAGRALVERELSLRSVAEHTLSLYRRLLTAS
jgi:glycosyltransferase involved in cell wall biosynthesis